MNIALSHEMSHASCQNLKAYTEVGHVPWQKVCNLFVVICSLFESSKEAPNSSRNASKLFRRGDWRSKKGANHVKVVPNNKVPISPT